MDRKTFHGIFLLITYAAALALLVLRLDGALALLDRALGLLQPVFIGFGISFVLTRPCVFFRRQFDRLMPNYPRTSLGLAVLCAYLSLFAAVAWIVGFIVPQFYDSVLLMFERIHANIPAMQQALNRLWAYLDLSAPDLNAMIPSLQDVVNGVMNTLSSTLPHVVSFTGGLMSAAVTGLMSLVFSVYMLAGQQTLRRQCSRLLQAYASPRVARTVSRVAQLTSDTFTKFISGQIIEACILGSLCFVGMSVLRLYHAPLISVIVGVSALIPVAGAYLGAVLSAVLLLMVSPVQSLVFLVFLVVLQQLEGNIIYPKVVGNSIGLPGLWVLVSVTVGGGLLGLLGMLLSVPAASVCYTLLRQDVNARLEEKEK